MRSHSRSGLLFAGLALCLSACSSGEPPPDEAAQGGAATPDPQDAVASPPAAAETPEQVEPADAARGKLVFEKSCKVCHSMTGEDGAQIGPALAGIVGKPSGHQEGFFYSPALADGKLEWTPQTLEAFLARPQKVAPGTRMTFAGLQDAQERIDVVAYLGK